MKVADRYGGGLEAVFAGLAARYGQVFAKPLADGLAARTVGALAGLADPSQALTARIAKLSGRDLLAGCCCKGCACHGG